MYPAFTIPRVIRAYVFFSSAVLLLAGAALIYVRRARRTDLGVQSTSSLSANHHDPVVDGGFEQSTVDLGSVLWGTQPPLQLPFSNRTASPFEIASVHTSCGCTTLDESAYAGLSLAPSESCLLDFLVSAGYAQTSRSVAVEVRTTDDGLHRCVINFRVTGTWSVNPSEIDFGEVALDDLPPFASLPERTIEFQSEGDTLDSVDVRTAAWLNADIVPDAGDSHTVRVRLRLNESQLPMGVSTANLVLHTSSDRKPDASLYIRIRRVPEISPDMAHVQLDPGGSTLVNFRRRDGRLATLRVADSTSPRVTARLNRPDRVEITVATDVTRNESVVVTALDTLGITHRILVSISLPKEKFR